MWVSGVKLSPKLQHPEATQQPQVPQTLHGAQPVSQDSDPVRLSRAPPVVWLPRDQVSAGMGRTLSPKAWHHASLRMFSQHLYHKCHPPGGWGLVGHHLANETRIFDKKMLSSVQPTVSSAFMRLCLPLQSQRAEHLVGQAQRGHLGQWELQRRGRRPLSCCSWTSGWMQKVRATRLRCQWRNDSKQRVRAARTLTRCPPRPRHLAAEAQGVVQG